MKAINYFIATLVTALFIISACQKENGGSATSEQTSVAAHSALGNGSEDPSNDPGASHVQWDIMSIDFPITTLSPGGVAFASAISESVLSDLKIRFTGSGTFVAPKSGGTSSAVTGGGTWETFSGAKSTGSGTYEVTKLASWEFASFWPQIFIDKIGNPNERAGGNAVLLIEYSDGSHGTLGLGCAAPGGPEGIQEGVIATKGVVTYWTGEVPTDNVDADRTLFHVRH